jgi:hypothetical protein
MDRSGKWIAANPSTIHLHALAFFLMILIPGACVRSPVNQESDFTSVIGSLEERFRGLGPFQAEFAFEGAGDLTRLLGTKRALLVLYTHPEMHRMAVGVRAASPQSATIRWFALLDGFDIYNWKEKAIKFECRTLWEGIDGLLFEIESRLAKLRGKAAPAADLQNWRKGRACALTFELGGRLKESDEEGVRFAIGWSPRTRASWLGEVVSERSTTIRMEKREVVFGLPSSKRVLTVDLETGFLRRFEAGNFDGSTISISLVRLDHPAPSPDLGMPEKFEVTSIPPIELQHLTLHFIGGLSRVMSEWIQLELEGKGVEAARVFSQMAALSTHAFHHATIAQWIHQYIRYRLDQGAGIKALQMALGDEIEAFLAWARRGDEVLIHRMEEVVEHTNTAAFSLVPGDLHAKVREALLRHMRSALRFEIVEGERRMMPEPALEALFRDEFARAAKN